MVWEFKVRLMQRIPGALLVATSRFKQVVLSQHILLLEMKQFMLMGVLMAMVYILLHHHLPQMKPTIGMKPAFTINRIIILAIHQQRFADTMMVRVPMTEPVLLVSELLP